MLKNKKRSRFINDNLWDKFFFFLVFSIIAENSSVNSNYELYGM